MKTLLRLIVCGLVSAGIADAASLSRSTITEVVKEVSVIQPRTRRKIRARAGYFPPPTFAYGAASRAEMIADDQTVTSVGDKRCSFEPEPREINLSAVRPL